MVQVIGPAGVSISSPQQQSDDKTLEREGTEQESRQGLV